MKADKQFEKLGFTKKENDRYSIEYTKYIESHKYTHKITILHKHIGDKSYALIQSYDPDLFDKMCIGNTCVGLTPKEMKACLKKVKELHW